MDIFSVVRANRVKVNPVRTTWVTLPVFISFEVNFDTNKSSFKLFDILENDFFAEILKEDTLVVKEFGFEVAEIDSSKVNSRLNLFSIPKSGPTNPILETLKLVVGTTTQSKRDNEPFSCSIIFDDNDFIIQIDFNSFFRNQPNSVEYSNLGKPMNTSLNFTHSSHYIISSIISNLENWEFVNYLSRLKSKLPDITIEDFHLSIDLINAIFHRKLIQSLQQKDFNCDRDPLIVKHGNSFSLNWAHLRLANYSILIKEVKHEVSELHKKHEASYK